MIDLRLGDCLEILQTLEDNSVDSVVCDPPYHLTSTKGASKGFMGKEWDGGDIAFRTDVWKECLRVLKPGGHLLAFSSSRTYHRIAVAIEDAGFDIRDQILWIYGQGFPKSHKIGKSIQKLSGDVKVVGKKTGMGTTGNSYVSSNEKYIGGDKGVYKKEYDDIEINNDYEGWGTALKPAHEPIVMARKPLSEKSIAENVIKWGTGGINIDECRIPANWEDERPPSWFNSGKSKSGEPTYGGNLKTLTDSTLGERLNDGGRFPANIILDEEAGKVLDEQSGVLNKQGKCKTDDKSGWQNQYVGGDGVNPVERKLYLDTGGASRFFYCPKTSSKEKNMGLEGLPEKQNIHRATNNGTGDVSKGMERFATQPKMNHHPTVKPIKLMEYLIKLVTPKGGVVMDCFMGSGSTGVAARNLGFKFIGIEREQEYMDIAKQRITQPVQTKLDI